MWSYTLFCLVMVARVMCHDVNTKIMEGVEASEGQFPYQVFIVYNRGQEYICGGSIISKKYILTAGHCLDDEFINDPSSVTVRAGSIYDSKGTKIAIDKALRHPNFNSHTLDNDVALLTTSSDIEFTNKIKAIDLPSKGKVVTGEVTVSGWGKTQNGYPSKLMYVNLTVVNYQLCEKSYGPLTENMWCAGNYDMGGPDTCDGDSGGPVVQEGLLVGIVSWGEGCGAPLKPSVFANVASTSIRDFITKNTGL